MNEVELFEEVRSKWNSRLGGSKVGSLQSVPFDENKTLPASEDSSGLMTGGGGRKGDYLNIPNTTLPEFVPVGKPPASSFDLAEQPPSPMSALTEECSLPRRKERDYSRAIELSLKFLTCPPLEQNTSLESNLSRHQQFDAGNLHGEGQHSDEMKSELNNNSEHWNPAVCLKRSQCYAPKQYTNVSTDLLTEETIIRTFEAGSRCHTKKRESQIPEALPHKLAGIVEPHEINDSREQGFALDDLFAPSVYERRKKFMEPIEVNGSMEQGFALDNETGSISSLPSTPIRSRTSTEASAFSTDVDTLEYSKDDGTFGTLFDDEQLNEMLGEADPHWNRSSTTTSTFDNGPTGILLAFDRIFDFWDLPSIENGKDRTVKSAPSYDSHTVGSDTAAELEAELEFAQETDWLFPCCTPTRKELLEHDHLDDSTGTASDLSGEPYHERTTIAYNKEGATSEDAVGLVDAMSRMNFLLDKQAMEHHEKSSSNDATNRTMTTDGDSTATPCSSFLN